MRKTAYLTLAATVVVLATMLIYQSKKANNAKAGNSNALSVTSEEEQEEGGYKRRLYEWKMLHDPATGEIPRDIRQKESALLASIQRIQDAAGFRQTINNTYTAAGPSQTGGRTRAIAYDMRNNQVMLAAGVSGGIFRSTNAGASWTFVHPANDVRIVSCLAQDPRPGFQDTWYAGTGELLGASPSYPNAFIPGYGIYKSTDNGITWTKLTSTISGTNRESFNDIFDMVYNVQVDGNGTVYAAILNYVIRSTNGGESWGIAIHETGELENQNQMIENMITDIVVSKPGVTPVRYYAAFSGRNRDSDTAGVWTSTTGTFGSWTRIGHSEQVTGWRQYNNNQNVNGSYTGGWGKTILAVSPSNSNILYVMYHNALSAASGQPEADLFRADLSSFPTVTWSANRNANLRALRNGTTNSYMELQDGYNMLLAVHPTNSNIVVAGGVNLYRSADAFATAGTFIGGLTSNTYSDPELSSHVDFHSFAFHPGLPNRLVTGHDGGMNVTSDITATTVSWSNLNSQYQTLQYYHVAIDPTAGSLTFAGGAQDNSTTYRDSKNSLNGSVLPAPTEANDHHVLIGGDGGTVGLSPSTTTPPITQYLYASVQDGDVYRLFANGATSTLTTNPISPANSPGSEFITYFHHDPDNPSTIYYAGLNTLWRTNNATTVNSNGWTELSGVSTALTGSIFSLATSRGTYAFNSSCLFIGTDNGKIYRLLDPRDGPGGTTPLDITPATGMTTQSLVRDIAVNPRNPDTVLAVVSNYGVASAFWTGNARSASPTWQLVEGNISLPSFRSCAIVVTATGVEYYVGTSIGLFSTTAISGASTNWTLEGPAVLQGAIIADLAVRPVDNTLLIGTHGNGMFYSLIGNVPTSVPDVIRNDKRFITSVFPTVANEDLYFRKGDLTGIQTINIRITSTNGQVVAQKTQSYQNGSVSTRQLASGNYVVEIWSDDRKYKHVQQFVKSK
jgi:hypothetical protein